MEFNSMLCILKDIIYINKLYDLTENIINNLNSSIFFNYLFPFIDKYCSVEFKEMILDTFTFKRYYYKLAEKLLILDFEQDLIFPKVSEIVYFILQPVFDIIVFISIIINKIRKYIMERPKLVLSIIAHYVIELIGSELNFITKLCYKICYVVGWYVVLKIKIAVKEVVVNIKENIDNTLYNNNKNNNYNNSFLKQIIYLINYIYINNINLLVYIIKEILYILRELLIKISIKLNLYNKCYYYICKINSIIFFRKLYNDKIIDICLLYNDESLINDCMNKLIFINSVYDYFYFIINLFQFYF
uniref:Uncharacterized protein n=1 Tax=Babesia rodhaini TaxID=5870 RepID=A0A455R2K0_BABRO|nr:hypothetical protein [Babesia rodhaini]